MKDVVINMILVYNILDRKYAIRDKIHNNFFICNGLWCLAGIYERSTRRKCIKKCVFITDVLERISNLKSSIGLPKDWIGKR